MTQTSSVTSYDMIFNPCHKLSNILRPLLNGRHRPVAESGQAMEK